MTAPKRHIVIPDTQVKHGVPIDHMRWAGYAVKDYAPDTVIHLGDHWDSHSMSTYDAPGSMAMEGARVVDDIQAGNEALSLLTKSMGRYKGAKVLLRGNHEYRMERMVNATPKLAGIVGYHLYNDVALGWDVVPYFCGAPGQRVIDGITYAHYFAAVNTGRAIGGTANNKLNHIGEPFVQGHVQGYDIGSKQYATGKIKQGIVAGSCLTPDHRVLTADLRYVPLGDVSPGDKLVSFDEESAADGKRSRRYRTGTVTRVRRDADEVFAVTLENGKVFKATADHLWLTRRQGTSTQWTRTDALQPRNLRGATHVPKLLDEWDADATYDGGWLSGMYDGEGCLYERTTTGGSSMQLSLAQKLGPVLEKARAILGAMGHEGLTDTNSKGVASLRIRGGRPNIAALLGRLRPMRLLAKFKPEMLARLSVREWVGVASIAPLGRQEIVRIEIDTKTMVVEGYGHHNCYLHDEDFKGMANGHWRGILVLNEVRDGSFCVMPLTMDYLCRKYEGVALDVYLRRTYRNAAHRFTLARKAA